MFDELPPAQETDPSVFEARLAEWLEACARADVETVVPSRTVVLELEPHGSPTAHPTAPDAAGAESPLLDVEPEAAGLAGLLEAGATHVDRAREAQRAQSRAAAAQARALAAFAASRPAGALDRPDTEVGAAAAASRAARPDALTAVSEWAVDEVMVALGLSSHAASAALAESVTLVEQLPGTLAALEEGRISPAHSRMLTEVLAPIADDTVRAEVEARVLARAAGKTVSGLRVAARRAVLRADASAAARRLAAAVRDRTVRGFPGKDGMGSLTATLPLPVLRACLAQLEAYAADCAVPGDTRTKDQRMVDCLVDLLLRPDAAGRPPVQAQLTIVASVDTLTGGKEPGEVDGQPVPAVLVRELAHTLGLLPRPHPDDRRPDTDASTSTSTGTGTGTGETASAAETEDAPAGEDQASEDPAEEASPGEDRATEDPAEEASPGDDPAAKGAPADDDAVTSSGLADLLRLPSIAGTLLAEPPRIAITDELSGQLLTLASPTEIRRAATCARLACRSGATTCTHPAADNGLGPPAATEGYRPTEAMQGFLRARDRRCRFPGCRTPAARCDLDHNRPWPAGTTSCDNLCCLCRHHHRLSHQAPGWTMTRLPDGGLQWTTPSGHTVTTHPPRYGTDDDLPPPRPTRLTLRERVLGRPATPEERKNDPAPF